MACDEKGKRTRIVLYEIINPSDPYTLKADDFKIAAAACLILGDGQYGLESEDGKEKKH